jgi:tRNA-dihydrouridine synthase C
MEGLTDFFMRDILTSLSPYDWCVSEFLRVTDHLYPASVFYKHCPEINTAGKTRAGTAVHLQLLGSDPSAMADNAAKAIELGAPAIDLNFGCPARTVNKSGGGAALLNNAELIHRIVSSVRQAVPKHITVSAKIRLGIESSEELLINAEAIYEAGASWLTVHARTKAQGYRPPVDWQAIGRVVKRFPEWKIIANGDINSEESLKQCKIESGCNSFMIGRAAVSQPDLVACLKSAIEQPMSWQQVGLAQLALINAMGDKERGIVGRYKQWLSMTTSVYPEAYERFQRLKRAKHISEILADPI